MNNYLKYLKYKQKYLDLKNLNLNGGNADYKLGYDDGIIGYNRYGNDMNYNIDYHRGRKEGKKVKQADIDYKEGYNDGSKNLDERYPFYENDNYFKGYNDGYNAV